MSTDSLADAELDPSGEVWVADLEKCEGGTGETMFRFREATVLAADRYPATGTGELEPFVWVDIEGVREGGGSDTMIIRLDRESARRFRDALTEVLGERVV